MRLIDQIGASETAAGGVLAAGNAWYFAAYARRRATPSRTAAAATLALVNAAFAAEAALYLALLPDGGGVEDVTALFVRTLVLVAVGAVTALVMRQRLWARGRNG